MPSRIGLGCQRIAARLSINLLHGPIMHRSSYTTCLGAWLAGACLFATFEGCGTSDYDKLVTRRLEVLRGEAKFRGLWAPTQLADTPIKIRVPMVFPASYAADSAHPDDGPKISPDRLQPPFLELPGFKICYEGTVTDAQNSKLPFYCYLAALPSKPGDAETLATEFQAKLKETFKDAPDNWEVVDCDSLSGVPVQWKKIRVIGEQSFRVSIGQTVAAQNLPGVFELWIRDAQDYVVIVGWRAPRSIEGPPAAPPANARLAQQAAGEHPDFSTLPVLTAGTITVDSAAGAGEPAKG
jgi:hypothetical protein